VNAKWTSEVEETNYCQKNVLIFLYWHNCLLYIRIVTCSRRYGVVEGRFCFEGGSRCGRGEGLHVCVTDQGEEITQTFQLAAQGKLAIRRRPVSRKMSTMDSPRKQIHSRPDTRHSDLSCTESFQQQVLPSADMTRSLFCETETCCACSSTESAHEASRHPSAEDLLCPCRWVCVECNTS